MSEQIGGGTALREALQLMVKELDWYAGKHGLGPARLQYALVRGREALALAAAAPAPPATEDYPGQAYVHAHNPNIKRAEENALGPPSKAERRVASAAILDLALSTLEKDWPSIPRTGNHDDVLIWAFHVDQLVRVQLAMLRAEARKAQPTPSLPEAVAGNASAPVGEPNLFTPEIIELLNKREAEMDAGKFDELAGQPSGVGEPHEPSVNIGDALWQRCLSLVEKCRDKTPDKWDFAYQLEQICKKYHVEYVANAALREVGEGLREKAIEEFYKFAIKVKKKEHWNIGGFLGEVWEQWHEQNKRVG